MAKSPFEMNMMLIITGVSNLAMLPAILLLHKQHRPFEAFIGVFTMLTSFLYHCCDSVDGSLWLTEGQWHRLDNIGSIMCFLCWSIYLMDFPNEYFNRICQYFSLGIVLLLQEKAPWNENYTIFPIVSSFLLVGLSWGYRQTLPHFDPQKCKQGFCFLGLGFACFFRGLHDETDPFRFFHGCWHFFIGIAAFFNYQMIRPKYKRYYDDKDSLPISNNSNTIKIK